MPQENVTKVKAGQQIVWYEPKTPATVRESCAGKAGYWACNSCRETFYNQLQKDSHLYDEKKHELVWVCPEHGFEVP